MKNVFAMVTLKSSNFYTNHALQSFFKNTAFDADDEFLLIDNDGNKIDDFSSYNKINIIKNKKPLSFSENVNQAITVAKHKNKNLVFLNNDIIFTQDWFEPLKLNSTSVSISSSNQLFQYKSDCGNLIIKPTMKFSDFNENFELLDKITKKHKKKFKPKQQFQTLLMPFFCFKIPYEILIEVGYFDEAFGKGGAEDIDYRIRCAVKGYEVNYILDSYLLHFHGKSTWDGAENNKETELRNKIYTEVFLKKWGKELTQIFILKKDFENILNKKGIDLLFKKNKFGEIIRKLL